MKVAGCVFFTTEYTEFHGVFSFLVIQSEAKDLAYMHVYASETLRYALSDSICGLKYSVRLCVLCGEFRFQ